MVQEGTVECPLYCLNAWTETHKVDSDLKYGCDDLAARAFLLDQCSCLQEVQGCIGVGLRARSGHRQDVRVKDYVLWVEAFLLGEYVVSPGTAVYYILDCIGLRTCTHSENRVVRCNTFWLWP